MKHLLITYAWSINNIGDMGIQAGTFSLLNRLFPGQPVKLITYLPENDPCYTHYRDVLPAYNPNSEVLPMPFFDLIGGDPLPDAASEAIRQLQIKGEAWRNFEARHGKIKLEQFRNGTISSFEAEEIADDLLNILPWEILADLDRHFPKLAAAFRDAGFVYYNSGTTLNFGRLGARRLFGYTLPLAMSLLIARALHIPYGIGSQSFDLIEWPMDLVYRQLFADAQFVFCRDRDSLHYLEQKRFEFKHLDFRPDATIFFDTQDEQFAEKFLQEHQLVPEQFMVVILRISNASAIYHDPTGGAVTPERCRNQMQRMKELIENFIVRTGQKVLIGHETRDTLGKNSAKKFLYDILSPEAQRHTVYLDEFWTPEGALAVFKRATLVCSIEMHSMIMCIGNGIPFIHPPYAECGRKRQMVKDMGLAKYLVDIDEPGAGTRMTELACFIAQHRAEVSAKIWAVRHRLEILARRTMKEVAEFLQ